MKSKLKYIGLLVMILISYAVVAQQNETPNAIELLSNQTDYQVGHAVTLKFSGLSKNTPLLYCSNSYGSTLVSGSVKNNIAEYVIPENMTKKIGVVNWTLLSESKSVLGTFQMNPKAEVTTMETYIGPPSIEAGGTDYTMLVVIPTDALDNPVPTNTKVNTKYQFLASEEKAPIYTKHLIAYKNINSKKESGRMLVSSESLGINSKEFTINVSAAIPSSFKISSKRPHAYADGNQITTFFTSIIKDRYNNTVSDGTFVTFVITNSKNHILKTSGTTLHGMASAKMIHPDYSDIWHIKAYIDGMAESNAIILNYKEVITDFNVTFTNNNRQITVGPLQSFMQQMIPDGLDVKLNIYQDNNLIKTLSKTSFNGYVNFKLTPEIYKNGTYSFSVETAGLSKAFKTRKLW